MPVKHDYGLIVVESPTKAKTIQKYVQNSKDYKKLIVLPTYGHVMDLLPKKGSVDPNDNFNMKYVENEKSKKHIEAIIEAAKKSSVVYLAADPDREGESICHNIEELLIKRLKKLKVNIPSIYRIIFHEITANAILKSMENPKKIAIDLVNAQKTRRALDYLLGFHLSPELWKKIKMGLSAGRVQSPAQRLIVERQDEIDKFIKQEYWSIESKLQYADKIFSAKLHTYNNEQLKQFSISNQEKAEKILSNLKNLDSNLKVLKIEKKQKRKHPQAPFTTSTLQQEAVKKIGLTTKATMRIAQNLYEGISVNGDSIGLITYMRTDSVVISTDAVKSIRKFIEKEYGKQLLADNIRVFKNKTKNAQEAHEAIRPTNIELTPEKIKNFLNKDQLNLYTLIWKRTVATQMQDAIISLTSLDIEAGQNSEYRATGTTILEQGFMIVSKSKSKNANLQDDKTTDNILPDVSVGDVVKLKELKPIQHFTEPPALYTEASLVKELERLGIGRPSTYASIINTLQTRNYVEMQNKQFVPTDIGKTVNKFLVDYFTKYVDYDFTASMEDVLDAIARGEKKFLPVLEEFWKNFKPQLDTISKNVKKSDVTQTKLDEKCPLCGGDLFSKLGKLGLFVGCGNYPTCRYTRNNINKDDEDTLYTSEKEVITDRKCEKCGSDLVYKYGKYGKFIGCSSYPKCKHIESVKPTIVSTHIPCPSCNDGEIVERMSRKKIKFYACSRYPDCKYSLSKEPIAIPCPICAWPLMVIKTTKKHGIEHVCPRKTCENSKGKK